MVRRHFIIITSILTVLLYMFITNGCTGKKQLTDMSCEERAIDYWERGITSSDAIKEVIRLSDSTYASIVDVENEGRCYYVFTTLLENKYNKGFGVFFPISGNLADSLKVMDENGEIIDKERNPEVWNKKMDQNIICILTKMVEEEKAYISKE